MAKYFCKWDIGYGESYEVVDAETQEEAESIAYHLWKEDYERQSSYCAELFTEDIAENYEQIKYLKSMLTQATFN